MPPPSLSSIVRDILSRDLDLPADEVIKKAKLRGATAPDTAIRHSVHNMRGLLKKQAGVAKPASVAAHQIPVASPGPMPSEVASMAAGDLNAVFTNVALVNKIIGVCGGVDQARQAAEAVRSCGSVDAFLQHLDLVAGIRTSGETV